MEILENQTEGMFGKLICLAVNMSKRHDIPVCLFSISFFSCHTFHCVMLYEGETEKNP